MVMPVAQTARHVKDDTHLVIDTEANPSEDDFSRKSRCNSMLQCKLELHTVSAGGVILGDIGAARCRIGNLPSPGVALFRGLGGQPV
jgi:hypothetical protein